MSTKNKITLFSFMLFLATVCAGLFAQKKHTVQIFSESVSKNIHLQKLDQQNPIEMDTLSAIQDDSDSDSDDLEKVKFDYSQIVHEYISFCFTVYSSYVQPRAIRNHNYTAAPRYILYHSLQIAC